MPAARILIIEDERQTVDTLRDLFEHHGYETEVALTRQVALTILQERKMDLAILSTEVQDASGIEILTEIKSANPNLPVIIISEQKSKRVENASLKAGASVFIIKPLEPEFALYTIGKLLEVKPATEEKKRKKTRQKRKR